MVSKKIIIAAVLVALAAVFGGAHASDYDKLNQQEKADFARYLGWVWGDGRPGFDGTGVLYSGGNPNYAATVARLAEIRFDGRTNPLGFPESGDRRLVRTWSYWDNSLPGGNPGDPQLLRDAIKHPNFLAGLLEGEGQLFHSDPTRDFYVADQSYAPSHPDRIYDIANFGPERSVQLLRLLAETYRFDNPSISVAGKKYAYNTQLCEAVGELRTEYERLRVLNERGDLRTGFTVRVFVNPPDFNTIRSYGFFEQSSGRFRTPAPDSLLSVITTSFPDQNVEVQGPTDFFDEVTCGDDANKRIGDTETGAPASEVFSSVGDSSGDGRFRRFEFFVPAGQETQLSLEWANPAAELRLFVLDPNDVSVASDITPTGSPKTLTVPAGVGGTYTASVLVADGSSAYTLRVNPESLPADFSFSSSGSPDVGRWQTFAFDVRAGDQVDALVRWGNPSADVRVFLRDETNAQVTRNSDGSTSAAVSAIAANSGRWSVGVSVVSGTVDYDVSVNVTSQPVPEVAPVVTNLALQGEARQSSTTNGGVASRAIDGNREGRYNRDSVTHTRGSNTPWWEVRLEAASRIETLLVFNRTNNCCFRRLRNYTVSILDDNRNVVFSQFYTESPQPSNIIDVGGITGRFVRVQLSGSGEALSLAEVEVMGYAE